MVVSLFRRMRRRWENKIPAAILGKVVILALLIWGMEVRANDEQPVSAISASSFALVEAARTPLAGERFGTTRTVTELISFDATLSELGSSPAPQGLDLSIPIGPTGEASAAIHEDAPRSARVARIASCHKASVGRYNSEERGAFSNALAEASEFEAAVVHFFARRESQTQFDSCSSQ